MVTHRLDSFDASYPAFLALLGPSWRDQISPTQTPTFTIDSPFHSRFVAQLTSLSLSVIHYFVERRRTVVSVSRSLLKRWTPIKFFLITCESVFICHWQSLWQTFSWVTVGSLHITLCPPRSLHTTLSWFGSWSSTYSWAAKTLRLTALTQ